jgi:mannosyl-oligosaccharide alpha-1,2-mannosidase
VETLSLQIGGFNWRDVTAKYPVQIVHRLPWTGNAVLPRIQYEFKSTEQSSIQHERRDAVKKTFLRGWNAYRANAWLHDEIMPISGKHKDGFGGWAATLVDSLDTLWLMDLKNEFFEAAEAAANINFHPDHSSLEFVNIFETTIRHLGGFLAAHDLTDCKDERLLQKAIEVGDLIYASYDTPNRLPITRWDIRGHNRRMLPAKEGILAELASASLEMTRLSQLTGNMKYYDAIARITNLLDEDQSKTQLPGMFPTAVDMQTGNFSKGVEFSLGAMSDSTYEYFGKTWQLLGGMVPQYRKLYEEAMNVATTHLLFRPNLPDQADVLISGKWHADTGDRDTEFQHLSCFAGGMYLLGGSLFAKESHIDIGRKLTDGCAWAYQHSPLGIMPEVSEVRACPTLEPCDYPRSRFVISPFKSVSDGRYLLRPEAIESVFYAYRITGDEKYRDIAWNMFTAIEKHTKVKLGNAGIKTVMKTSVEHEDSTESFWFSETLKYFYLIFSEPGLVSLDEWVFNTEAHAFRLPKRDTLVG